MLNFRLGGHLGFGFEIFIIIDNLCPALVALTPGYVYLRAWLKRMPNRADAWAFIILGCVILKFQGEASAADAGRRTPFSHVSNEVLLPLLFPSSMPRSESTQERQNGRRLLNAGACSRGAQNYESSNVSPFLSSSLSFDPILAGAQTEVVVVFRMAHEICRGDKILVKLSNFSFEPGLASDPEALDTRTDSQSSTFSKYTAAWDQSQW